MDLKELRSRRETLSNTARSILTGAEAEKHALTDAEKRDFDGITAKIEALSETLKRAYQLGEIRADIERPIVASPVVQQDGGMTYVPRNSNPGEVRAYKPNEAISETRYHGAGIGAYVRGVVTGRWNGAGHFVEWLGIANSKFYGWRERYGKVNEHNGWVPRDFWLEQWEKEAIVDCHLKYPLEGYRRLTFMMLDAGIVAVSPSSVWRVLGQAGLLAKWNGKASKKGTGFEQPLRAHEHWHIDVSCIHIGGTFYYLCSVRDGFSRALVHWDLRESMTEAEIEIILQRAREKYPEAKPRIISGNGPQFIARDFKEFIRISGMTHVRTSPYYPQSNGKIERWHKSIKAECIRPGTPLTKQDALRLIGEYVEHYNTVRLHSATGYITPADMLAGRQMEILAERDRRLEQARQQRQEHRRRAA